MLKKCHYFDIFNDKSHLITILIDMFRVQGLVKSLTFFY